MYIIKEIKKLHPRALLSNISTWEFLRTLEKCEKHSAAPRASLCTSLVFLKIPACLYNSTMHSDAFFISLIMHAAYVTSFSARRSTQKCEKHSATPRASLCTSLVFLKIPACLYNSTIHSGAFFISLTDTYDVTAWCDSRA